MARLLFSAINKGNKQVISDVQRIAGAYENDGWLPKSAQALTRNLFQYVFPQMAPCAKDRTTLYATASDPFGPYSTIYMGMATQSSSETRKRAEDLATVISSYHTNLDIDDIFNAQKKVFAKATGIEPRFRVHGGSTAENLALQNIQARTRMVTAYEFSQMLPTVVSYGPIQNLCLTFSVMSI